MTFSEAVVVTGEPRLRLTIGEKKRWARYSHSDEDGARIIFSYRVKAADSDDNGVSIGKNAIDPNGGTIEDADGNRARLRHSKVADQSGHKVNGSPEESEPEPPSVTEGPILNSPQSGDTYGGGEQITVSLTFSEPVSVSGEPRLGVVIGENRRWAGYSESTAGGATLVFAYEVRADDRDDDGLSIEQNSLELNGGSIEDAGGNTASLEHPAVADLPSHKVDGSASPFPAQAQSATIWSATLAVKTGAVVINGCISNLRNVDACSSALTDDKFTYGGTEYTVNALYWLSSGSQQELVIRLGSSSNTIKTALSSVTLHTGGQNFKFSEARTRTTNDDIYWSADLGWSRGHSVTLSMTAPDNTAPTVSSVAITSSPPSGQGGYYKNGDAITATVTFSEAVTVTGAPTLTIKVGTTTSAADKTATCAAHATDNTKLVCTYTVVAGDADADGIAIEADKLALPTSPAATIKDGANNNATLTHSAVTAQASHKVDGVKPTAAFPTSGMAEVGMAWTIALADANSGVKKYGAIVVDASTGAAGDCDTATEVGSSNLTTEATAVAAKDFDYTLPDGSQGKKVCVYVEDAAGNSHSALGSAAIVAAVSRNVTLVLSRNSINESGANNSATITATLENAARVETTVTVSATPVSPATASDYTLSANKTLTFAANATASTGTVTITAVDNSVLAANKTVTLSGTVDSAVVVAPGDVTLTILEDGADCTGTTAMPSGASAGLIEDCRILLASKETLEGARDPGFNWSVDTAIGSWTGITVTSGRVTVISGHNLSGTLPPQLGDLTGLTEVQLSENALTGPIPAELGSLTSLTRLELDRNDLTGPIPAELGSLTGLLVLFLDRNELTGPIPAALGSLTKLETLNLSDNDLAGAIPSELGGLTKLYTLRLSDNKLTGSIPAALASLANLTHLDLSSNELTGPIPVALASLTKIESQNRLDLKGNKLTGTVTLELSPTEPIQEDGGPQTITVKATVDAGTAWAGAAGEGSTVTVSVSGSGGGGDLVDFTAVPDFTIAIPFDKSSATGTFTLTPTGDGATKVDEANETITVSATGTGANAVANVALTAAAPLPTLTLVDDNLAKATLVLSRASINESGSGNSATVTATLPSALAGDTVITVSAAPVDPATAADYTLSENTTLTISAGATNSTGTVTITAVDNGRHSADKRITISGDVAGDAVFSPDTVTLTIVNDDVSCQDSTATPSTSSEGLVADCEILLASKDTLRGAPKQGVNQSTANWSVDTAIASWTGIRVKSGRVTVISGHGLSGTLPPLFGGLTGLTEVQLGSNTLTGPIPAELGSLTNLTRLELEINELSGPIPAALGSLANLTHLDLSSNDLTGPIPAALGGLTNLTFLNLSGNDLTGPIPAALASLTNLAWLKLNNNDLTGPIPSELGSLTSLEQLELNDNDLTGAIPAWLASLTNLGWLKLNDNDLTGPIPAALASLTKIDNQNRLDLKGNKLTGTVTIELSPTDPITEDGGPKTITVKATVDAGMAWAGAAESGSTVTVSVSGSGGAGDLVDFAAVPDFTIAIPFDKSSATGTFTLTPTADGATKVDEANETITVSATGTGAVNIADAALTAAAPLPTLTLVDEILPKATLVLSRASINESGSNNSATVTATLASAVAGDTVITVSAAPVNPATVADYTLSENTLTIPAGATQSSGAVTITAVDNGRHSADKRIALSGVAAGDAVISPDPATLTIVNDDVSCQGSTATPSSSSLEVLVADCEILLASGDILRGSTTLNWSKDTDIMAWEGVTLMDQGDDDEYRVTQVNLSSKNLGGSIPGLLSGLSRLSYLKLSDNQLTGEIPAALGGMSLLKDLYLQNNRLTGTIPAFTDLPLTSLDLRGNSFTSTLTLELDPADAVPEGSGERDITVTATLDPGTAWANDYASGNSSFTVTVTGSGPGRDVVDFQEVEAITLTMPVGSGSATGTFKLNPTADAVDEEDETVTVSASGAAVPGALDAALTATASLTLTDDDTRGVTVSPTGLEFPEGGIGTYAVKLDSAPTANVTITPSSNNTDVTFTPASLTFTASSYSEKTVTVTGGAKGDTATISHAVAGGDYGANSVTAASVSVTVTDAAFSSATTERSVAENSPPGTNVGAVIPAATGDTLTYSLGGTDAASFDFDPDTRQISVKSGTELDYETTPRYTVTVNAADGRGGTGIITVTIIVTNEEEAGSVTFGSATPKLGAALTATLADPDVVQSSPAITWAWAKSDAQSGPFTAISGATSASYTPIPADMGKWLQATASYSDGHGPDKSASAATANAVAVTPALPLNSPLIPQNDDGEPLVAAGQRIRLLFVTSDTTTLPRVPAANSFVQARANAVEHFKSFSSRFRALYSIGVTHARDNTGTTFVDEDGKRGLPIYWVGGARVADDYKDFYDGDWDSNAAKKEDLGDFSGRVWTGSSSDGTAGSARTRSQYIYGEPATSGKEINSLLGAFANLRYSLYALSPAVTVVKPPGVKNVAITSTPAGGGTYKAGEVITVAVTFSEAVVVTGKPQLAIKFDSVSKTAECALSAANSAKLACAYTVKAGDADADGIEVEADKLTLPAGASIENAVKYDATLDYTALAAQPGHKVDAILPKATLALSRNPIDESGANNSATITATLDRAATAETTVTVSAAPVSPATASDFTLSSNKTLTFAANATNSTGTVTITAVDNKVDAANKTVTVSGIIATGSATAPDNVTLTITDDDESCAGSTATPSATSSTELVEDCEILLTSRDTLAGTATLNWSTDTAIGSWDGITVDGGRVTKLELSNESLNGTIPSVLSGLTSLTALDLTGNRLTGTVTLTVAPQGVIPEDGGGKDIAVTATLDAGSAWANGFAAGTVDPEASGTFVNVSASGSGAAGDLVDFADVGMVAIVVPVGESAGEGQLRIVPVKDSVDEADETVTLSAVGVAARGTADIRLTTAAPAPALKLTDDDLPKVSLVMDPSAVSENGGVSTVKATLSSGVSGVTTVTVFQAPGALATNAEHRFSANKTLTIAANATESAGTVTITAVDNADPSGDKHVSVTASVDRQDVYGPAAATLTVTDDDTRVLTVSPSSLSVVAGASATYTVVVDEAPTADVTVTPSSGNSGVSFAPASLTFTSTDYSEPKTVTVNVAADADTGAASITHQASGGGFATQNAASITLTITATPPPKATLVLTPASISEDGGVSTVTATLPSAPSADVTITVSAAPVSPAVAGDFTLSANKTLTIAAGETESAGLVTITAVDNSVFAANKTVAVSGASSNTEVAAPASVTLLIAEDDYVDACADGAALQGQTLPSVKLQTLALDCEVLLASRDVLRGTATLNWSADLAIGSWTGVILGDGRVTNLVLSNKGLSGSIPKQLGSLSELWVLAMIRNELTGPIPKELGSLSKLGFLQLNENELTGAIPKELGSLSKLGNLQLNENELTGAIPKELGSLSDLQILNLYENELTGAIPKELGNLSKVTNLNLTGNELTGTATLALSPTDDVAEGGGAKDIRVTATLDAGTAWAHKFANNGSTVTVSVSGSGAADAVDFAAVNDFSITIPKGESSATGTFTLTPTDDGATKVDEADETITVSATGTGAIGVADAVLTAVTPLPTLTLTDGSSPKATLVLSSNPVNESGGTNSATITATLDKAAAAATTITVSAAPISPAVAGDFTLSANKTLTIASGQTASTGAVTITAVDNDVDAADKQVTVSGSVTAGDVTGPSDVTLTITDDDPPSIVFTDTVSTVWVKVDSFSVTPTGAGTLAMGYKLVRAAGDCTVARAFDSSGALKTGWTAFTTVASGTASNVVPLSQDDSGKRVCAAVHNGTAGATVVSDPVKVDATAPSISDVVKLLTAPEASGKFGFSVAIDGDTAIVGSYEEDTVAGAAYIFTRSGSVWAHQAKIQASDKDKGDSFGLSVAIDGDTAIVGAYEEDTGGVSAGAAYVFTRSGTAWTQQAKIQASDKDKGDSFGGSVAIDGDTAIVGAYGEDTGGDEAGAAYVFTRSGSGWTQQAKIQASDKAAGDYFGNSVAIDGDTAIAGAYLEGTGGTDAGAAYVFTRSGTAWMQQAKIQASDKGAGDQFGYSVAIDGDTAIVGAFREDTGGTDADAAYVFTRSGSAWSQQAKIQASDKAAGDEFGYSVAIDGDTAIVGAFREDTGGTDAGAAYVFTRSGSAWSQQAKIQASDKAAGDEFGYSVAIDGDTAVVGAFLEDTGGTDAGAAYVFTRGGSAWSQQAKMQGSDTSTDDRFGYSVAIDGDTAVVGAFLEDTGGADAGAAYVFTRGGSAWSQQAKMQGSDTSAGDNFGYSVAIDGDTAIVGAWYEDTGGEWAGAAYVFTRGRGGSWTQQAKIQASDTSADDVFGVSVAIDGDTAIVGARFEDTGGQSAGAAYVFTRSGSAWTQQAKIQASDKGANDYFGVSVAIDGDTAIVGANQEDTGGTDAGAAYVFTRSGTAWTQQAKIQGTDTSGGDYFGYSVAIDGDTAVVGAWYEDTGGADAGAAYIFTRSGSAWTQQAKIQASDKEAGDRFGSSVAIDGDTAIVGAYYEDTGGSNAGAAYVFTRSGGAWTQLAKIQADDKAVADYFGNSVAIDGDSAIVGAYGEDTGGTGAGAAYVHVIPNAGANYIATLSDPFSGVAKHGIAAITRDATCGTAAVGALTDVSPAALRDTSVTFAVPESAAGRKVCVYVEDAVGNSATSERAIPGDPTANAAPFTVAITGPTTTQNGPFDVTLTFSEAVKIVQTEGVPLGIFALSGGTKAGAAESVTATNADTDGYATVWTARIKPGLKLSSGPDATLLKTTPYDIEISVGSNVGVTAGGTGNLARGFKDTAADLPLTVKVDLPPEVRFAVQTGPPSSRVAQGKQVQVFLSERVKGLTLSDITVSAHAATSQFAATPALDDMNKAIAGYVTGATFFLTATTAADVTLTLPANAVTDKSDLGNAVTTATVGSVLSATAATVTITGPATPPTIGYTSATSGGETTYTTNPVAVTLTFSKPVTGLTKDDLTVTNGEVKADPAATSPTNGYAAVWTAQVTPLYPREVRVGLPANKVTDAASGGNVASSTYEFTVNSNAPVLPASVSARSIAENSAAGTNVGAAITATDADAVVPDPVEAAKADDDETKDADKKLDTVRYSLEGTDAEHFRIDGKSGQLKTFVRGGLNYENTLGAGGAPKRAFAVTVKATDAYGKSDTVALTINLTDVNEPPAFPATTATRSIAENSAAGANVGAAIPAATDPDTGSTPNTVSYTMGGTDAGFFEFNATSRQITVKSGTSLDYEAKRVYRLTVTASDGTLSDSIAVTINVTDQAKPQKITTLSATAGAAAGSLSVTWTAPDNTGRPDITGYKLEYRRGSTGTWTAWAHSGTATSATITGLTGSTAHQVRVRAANADGDGPWSAPVSGTSKAGAVTPNNAPTFASSGPFSVAENASGGAAVGTVVASDADGDALFYHFDPPGETNRSTHDGPFEIGLNTGRITLRSGAALNYETKSSYTVKVVAWENRGGATTVDVTINVTDVAEPPLAPTGLSVAAVSGSTTSLRASWTDPDNTGRPAITGYTVQYKLTTAGTWTVWTHSGTGTSTTITGLTGGRYQVRVRADNDEGGGAWATASGTTNRAPLVSIATWK